MDAIDEQCKVGHLRSTCIGSVAMKDAAVVAEYAEYNLVQEALARAKSETSNEESSNNGKESRTLHDTAFLNVKPEATSPVSRTQQCL